LSLLTLNTGVPFAQVALTLVVPESPSLLRKRTLTALGPELLTLTAQLLSGWAIRSMIVAPVQRTETCPPGTLTVRSREVLELGVLVAVPGVLVEVLGVPAAVVDGRGALGMGAATAGRRAFGFGLCFGLGAA
jgi:hypothetical protein